MHANARTSDGFFPIPAVLSSELDNIALLSGSSDGNTWKAIAFKVNQVNRRTEYINNLPTLEPGGTLDFGFLGENGHSEDSNVSDPGNDQLRISDNEDETLVEYGISVKPSGVLVGVQNPANADITGIQDTDRLRGWDASSTNADNFSDFGAVRSDYTQTENGVPTTALSPSTTQGIFRFDKSDDRNNTYFGFRSLREDDAPLEVAAHGLAYKVTPILDPNDARDVVFGNGVPRRVVTYGGLDNTKASRPDVYQDAEITITGQDARNGLSQSIGGGA